MTNRKQKKKEETVAIHWVQECIKCDVVRATLAIQDAAFCISAQKHISSLKEATINFVQNINTFPPKSFHQHVGILDNSTLQRKFWGP